jgi:hypothetical protein
MEALRKRVGDLPEDVSEFDRSLRTIRTEEHKLIRGSDGTHERYHLAEDPSERIELSETDANWSAKLEVDLDAWLDSFDHAEADSAVSMSSKTKDRLEDLGYLQ